MKKQIINGNILAQGRHWINGGSIIINNDKITEIRCDSMPVDGVGEMIDAHGGFVLPGAIDLHVHGGGGCDFMEGTREAFETIVHMHRRHGTTALFPTLAASTREQIVRAAKVCSGMMQDKNSGVLGLHLEGPYFDPVMAGGQIAENIRKPAPEEYIPLVDNYHCIARWDAAPEIPGALAFGQYLRKKGIVAGIAHTRAGFIEVQEAFDAGYTMATHFYNAMTSVHKEGIYKHAGTVEAIYLIDDIDVEVIADGIHVPPEILRLVHKIKGPSRTCLVTDAMSLTASPDSFAFDPRVIIKDGACQLKDGSALAGSCATMDRLVRTAVSAGIPLEDISAMVSSTPARIMGVSDRKGSLTPGKDADIVIYDPSINLTHVIAMGIQYLH
ncbi:MAG: N-acetylglucosamine-6-phosphate deacetylase [Muribaculaceae bacterium]|nr:N-acetylglucosamine-6-phosphate deacetylase [Muribaculaceae bacterium]